MHYRHMAWAAVVLQVFILIACTEDSPPTDSGIDGGIIDAGEVDGGIPSCVEPFLSYRFTINGESSVECVTTAGGPGAWIPLPSCEPTEVHAIFREDAELLWLLVSTTDYPFGHGPGMIVPGVARATSSPAHCDAGNPTDCTFASNDCEFVVVGDGVVGDVVEFALASPCVLLAQDEVRTLTLDAIRARGVLYEFVRDTTIMCPGVAVEGSDGGVGADGGP